MKDREKMKRDLQAFFRELEGQTRKALRGPVGTVKNWGNKEFVKVESGWVPLIRSKNAGC